MDALKKADNSFFNKKNTVFFAVFICITAVILFLTFWFVLNLNWNDFASVFAGGVRTVNGWLFLLAMISIQVIGKIPWAYTLSLRLQQSNVKTSIREYISHMMIVSFISVISPIPFLASAYVVYWLRHVGVKLSDAIVYGFFSNFINALSSIIVTLPAWIWVLINTNTIWNHNSDQGWFIFTYGRATYLLTFWGMSVYILTLVLQFFLGYARKLHYFLSRLWNRTKKILRLDYHTKEQTHKTYMQNAHMKQLFIGYFRDKKLVSKLFLIGIVGELTSYTSATCAFAFAGISYPALSVDYWKIFNIINISYTANVMIPLPGGNGTIQMIMQTLMDSIGGISNNSPNKMDFINNGIAVQTLIPMCFSMLGLIWLVIFCVKEVKTRKKHKT